LVALVAVGMPQEVARQVVELQTLAAAVAVMVALVEHLLAATAVQAS
jgi:hypothetical protein